MPRQSSPQYFGLTLNLFCQIGMIMLIGPTTKSSILTELSQAKRWSSRRRRAHRGVATMLRSSGGRVSPKEGGNASDAEWRSLQACGQDTYPWARSTKAVEPDCIARGSVSWFWHPATAPRVSAALLRTQCMPSSRSSTSATTLGLTLATQLEQALC